jgi:hypothetical protein
MFGGQFGHCVRPGQSLKRYPGFEFSGKIASFSHHVDPPEITLISTLSNCPKFRNHFYVREN